MSLLRSGELRTRIGELRTLLSPCRLCPRNCGTDRLADRIGVCGSGAGAVVAAATAHFGEEPEIAGSRGSGAVFFAGCNLRCVYCQNHAISQGSEARNGGIASPSELGRVFLELQSRGCHNLNWVTPSHVVPFALEGLAEAAGNGFSLPVVYNSSGYDSLETIRLLEGVVDVWLPDLRYSDDETAGELSGAVGYVDASRAAVLEMARQVGTDNVLDDEGTIRRGLVVRLLVLPNDLAGVRETLRFLRDEVGTGLRIALMAQYYPAHNAADLDLLSRGASQGEYLRMVEFAERLGFHNALVQDLEASSFYRPDFQLAEEPFADASRFRP